MLSLNKKEKKSLLNKMRSPIQRKLLLFLLFLSFVIFTICLIPYSILLSFLLFSLILCIYLKFEFSEIKKTGLFPYMPEHIKQILLTRSVFDILCDVWYIPSFSTYFKIFIRPFIYQIKPEEAIENLSELSKTQRDKALMKGVINLLPQQLQDIIIPNKETIVSFKPKLKMIENCEKKEEKITSNPNNESMISNHSTIDSFEIDKKLLDDNEDEEKVYLLRPEINRNFQKPHNSLNSQNFTKNNYYAKEESDCIANKMNRISFFNFDKEELDSKRFAFELLDPSENESKHVNRIISKKPTKPEKPTNSYVVADRKSLKIQQESFTGQTFKSFTTKVLNSSKKIAQINLMEQMKKACEKSKLKWDRLENFLDNKFIKKNIWGDQNLKPAFRIPMNLIKKFQDLKKSGLNIQKKPLLKLFLGSNLLLCLLFTISKRSRGWLIYSLLALLYAAGFLISTGSLTCFLMKYFLQRKGKELKDDEKKN